MFFILKGEGLATCDGKSVAIQAGDSLLVPPGTHKRKYWTDSLIRSVYYGAE